MLEEQILTSGGFFGGSRKTLFPSNSKNGHPEHNLVSD